MCPHADTEIMDYKDLDEYNSIDYPFRSERDVKSFIPARSLRVPKKAKIIEECCLKPCFISELQTYCA